MDNEIGVESKPHGFRVSQRSRARTQKRSIAADRRASGVLPFRNACDRAGAAAPGEPDFGAEFRELQSAIRSLQSAGSRLNLKGLRPSLADANLGHANFACAWKSDIPLAHWRLS